MQAPITERERSKEGFIMVTNINKGQVVDRTKELIAGSEQIMTGGLENRIGNVETNATRHVGV